MILSNDCWLKNKCKKYEHDKSCDENIFCLKLFKLDVLYNLSLLSFSQRNHVDLRLDSSKSDEIAFKNLKAIQENIENFIKEGNNLYIYSSITGNGKTAWAIRLMQSYFNSIWYKSDLVCKGLFISVPRYLLAIKDNISSVNEYAQSIKERVYDADIVIWDDIGTKSATQFEHETLLSIIDYRINDKKTNIFTSNISPEKLKEFAGDRLYSRIINYSTVIEFLGSDKRGIL